MGILNMTVKIAPKRCRGHKSVGASAIKLYKETEARNARYAALESFPNALRKVHRDQPLDRLPLCGHGFALTLRNGLCNAVEL